MLPMIGGIGVVVVVLVVLMSGGSKSNAGGQPAGAAPAPASKPAAAPAPAPMAVPPAKPGKTPATPAPALTGETLGRLRELHAEAKAHYNQSVTARNGGDTVAARKHAMDAKKVLDQWLEQVQPCLTWQESAQMEDWTQPGEYLALEKLYGDFQSLTKMVRLAGG